MTIEELTELGYMPVEQTKAMVEQGKIDKAVAANLLLGRRMLDRAGAILVTKGISREDTEAMGFDWAADPGAALEMAMAKHGRSASINILYKAAKMICRIEDEECE